MPTTGWSYRPGRGEATVALHESTEGSADRPVAVVSWKGDDHLLPYVPGAYFDKIFCNLRNDPLAAQDLLDRVVFFVHGLNDGGTEALLAGSAGPERMAIPGKGGIPLPAAVVQDEASDKSYAGVKAKIIATDSVLGATTHFRPKFRGQNPTVAEFGFWALWDWRVLLLLQAGQSDALSQSFNSFAYQLSLYQQHGVPSFTEMGAAAWAGAMHGVSSLELDLPGHLERTGLAEPWWRTAEQAIRLCEEREANSPVLTGMGPVPARTIVAVLALAPFVQGEIDWDSPLYDEHGRELPGKCFYPPNEDVSFSGDFARVLAGNEELRSELQELLYPTAEGEDVRWVSPADLDAVLDQADSPRDESAAAPFDIHYLTGRVRYELADIATADDGTPLQFPEWALREVVATQILIELDLMDSETMQLQNDEGFSENGPYAVALRRLVTEHDLTSVVDEVFDAVTARDPRDLQ